jgi:hypothetical protein
VQVPHGNKLFLFVCFVVVVVVFFFKYDAPFFKTQLQTNGATDWEFFTIGKEAYLVVANAYNYGSQNYLRIDSYSTNSTIYRLNMAKRVFEKYQSIPTFR